MTDTPVLAEPVVSARGLKKKFGGKDRISKTYIYTAEPDARGTPKLRIYLPARTALCLRKIKDK